MQKFVLNEADDLATIANQLERVTAKRAAEQADHPVKSEEAAADKVHDVTERAVTPQAEKHKAIRTQTSTARKVRPLAFVLGAVAVALLAVLSVVFTSKSHADTYTVPNLLGQKVVRAQEAMSKAGFRAHLDFDPRSKKPVGTVIGLTPVAGTKAKKGTIVTLKVAGKRAIYAEPVSTPAPPPPVAQVQQEPVKKADPVEKPSAEKEKTEEKLPTPPIPTSATVPDVRNMAAEKGRTQLIALGFATREVLVRDPEQPDGNIIALEPKPGTNTDFGAVVTLQINKLPDAPSTPVNVTPPSPPTVQLVMLRDYVGMSSQEAVNGLRQQGFNAEWGYKLDPKSAPGVVINTDPPAGSRLTPGTYVRVFISR